MRSTLFYIPHAWGPLPLLGLGWLLLVLVVAFAVKVGYVRYRTGSWARATADWVGWLIALVAIVFLLPRMETSFTDGAGNTYPVGLPVRGYGLFLMLGVLAAVWLTLVRSTKVGLDLDGLLSLSVFTVIGGILGARLFFVIQKWSELPGETVFMKLWEAVKFTEGGLVVFGSFIGGALAVIWWARRRRYRLLVMGDLIVPGLMLGLCLGRLGCFMNGCCYAGVCEGPWPKVRFPRGSLAYMEQLQAGPLLGLEWRGEPDSPAGAEVLAVRPGSWAASTGVKVGDRIRGWKLWTMPPARGTDPAGPSEVYGQLTIAGQTYLLNPELPRHSLPVHPIQLYASLNAGLIAAFLFFLWPNVARDGLVLGAWLVMCGTSRMLEEWIRIDEIGQFGTSLTISQWISLLGMAGGLMVLGYCWQRPPSRASLLGKSRLSEQAEPKLA
jgi:phosphatidylglycerol:prolipoprotein diacylglycerol transferase